MQTPEVSILFVCMGNICRSPTAEGVFRELSQQCDLKLPPLKIDSCGTIGYHQGEAPDSRSVSAAKARGYDLSVIRSRKIIAHDLERFDYVLAMDFENLANLEKLARDNQLGASNIKLFMDYSSKDSVNEVPDPYYGGASGFDQVIDLIENASEGLLNSLHQPKVND